MDWTRLVDLLPSGHAYRESCCLFYATYNQHHVYPHLNLTLTAGSLAVDGEWRSGNPAWMKVEEFRTHPLLDYTMNAHVWLQDAHGNIYDIHVHTHEIMERKTNEEMSAIGFTYVQAPCDILAINA
jgi:hypothetical protein